VFGLRERILSGLKIKDVIMFYCPTVKFNRQNRCACPIHGGENNNLQIYERTDSFYCFTCKSAGDLINFVSKYFGITYREATKKIALDFGFTDGQVDFKEFRRLKELCRRKKIRAKMDEKHGERLAKLEAERDIKIKIWLGLKELYDNFLPVDADNIDDRYVLACRELPKLEFDIEMLEYQIEGAKKMMGRG
jgi:DNA primase